MGSIDTWRPLAKSWVTEWDGFTLDKLFHRHPQGGEADCEDLPELYIKL